MNLEFDVQISAADLYDFMMFHIYHGPMGLIGATSGALFILVFAMNGRVAYLIAGLLLLFYVPCSLYLRSKQQALQNDFSKKIFHYIMSDEGIRVKQGEEDVLLAWEEVYKSTASNRNIFIYTSKVNAWIFPKRILGERKTDFIQMISQHVDPSKVKIKQ